MRFSSIHRVVTGHDAEGKAIVVSDGPLSTVTELQALPGVVFHEVWSTAGTPARIDNGADPSTGPLLLPPPSQGASGVVEWAPVRTAQRAGDALQLFSAHRACLPYAPIAGWHHHRLGDCF